MSGQEAVGERSPYGSGRSTTARRAVASAVDAAEGAFTVDDLVESLVRTGSAVGTATVYRAVAAMEACGHVERVGSRGDASLYLRCGESHHHHHVVCDSCGRVAEAPCPLTLPTMRSSDGFVVTRHEVALYGLCPDCAQRGDS